jgi:hypothetical protein
MQSEGNICPIHKVGMRWFENGEDSWLSHRTDDPNYPKGWCNGRPFKKLFGTNHNNTIAKEQVKEHSGKSQEYWDKKSKIIALCGLANALLSSGKDPDLISIKALGDLLLAIEKKADEMTRQETSY